MTHCPNTVCRNGSRRSLRDFSLAKAFAGAVFLALVGLTFCSASADKKNDVARVEEDWELVVRAPGAQACPQMDTVMLVEGDRHASFARTTWNYRELPDVNDGGLQIQGWYDDQRSDWITVDSSPISASADTIVWTQVLEVTGRHKVVFRLKNGRSAKWGKFGGNDTAIELYTSEPRLNNYSSHCQINYGVNKVERLRIKEVRFYDDDNRLIRTETKPVVFFKSDRE